MPDGVTVEVGEDTDYEPDAIVNCGPPIPLDNLAAPNPIIIVEVLSRSTRGIDAGVKLADYFLLPSLRNYLLFATERPSVVHHRRADDGVISTSFLARGSILLDPPGVEVDLSELYPPERIL